MTKYERIELDFAKTQQIYDYFYSKEELISICRDFKNSLVFKGGIDLEFGGGLFSSNGLKNPDTQRNTVDLLQRALDYKDMFGLCPYKVKRNDDTGLPEIRIPEFGFGRFILLKSSTRLETKVEYRLFDKKKSLKVFVWPGLEPSLTGEFKSKIFKLYATYARLEEYVSNNLDADYELTHPTIVTHHKMGDPDITKLTEEEVYGDADPNEMNPDERSVYRRNVVRGRMLEAQMSMMRSPTQSMTPGREGKNVIRYDSSQHQIVFYQRGDTFKDRLYPLGTGEEIARQQIPVIGNQIKDFRLEYEYMVCLAFGIPRDYLMTHKGVLRGTAIKEREIIQTRVEDDRKAAEIFYQYVYDRIYREEDTRVLVDELVELKRQKKEATGDDKKRREIKDQKRTVNNIALSKNRVKLKFLEDPFRDTIDAKSIIVAADRGYITRKEEIALYRAHLGLTEISIKVLDKDNEERQKLNEELEPQPSPNKRKKDSEENAPSPKKLKEDSEQ